MMATWQHWFQAGAGAAVMGGGLALGGLALGGLALGGLALGGSAYASRWPGSKLFGSALVAPQMPGELALTFDDGPHPRWTPRLLEILGRNEIRATFFLIGRYAAGQSALVREMHAAGHLIGNHTWTHPDLSLTSVRKTQEELTRTNDQLEQLIGAAVRLFRPPYGARRPATLRIARDLGMTPVLWNAMAGDWAATGAEQITTRMLPLIERNQRRGFASNIVLHDGSHLSLDADRSASVAAAGEIIERFKSEIRPPCQFVTLDAWT